MILEVNIPLPTVFDCRVFTNEAPFLLILAFSFIRNVADVRFDYTF